FALVYWTRDPDGTQHNHGDGGANPSTIFPGINGETSKRGVRNADRSLQRLLAWLDAHPEVRDNTDLGVTSDPGFATIGRTMVGRGRASRAEPARHDYLNAEGRVDTLKGTLPEGFLALDLAYDLQLNVFDPDQRLPGSRLFRQVRIGSSSDLAGLTTWEHPNHGSALLGVTVQKPDGSDARLI